MNVLDLCLMIVYLSSILVDFELILNPFWAYFELVFSFSMRKTWSNKNQIS